MCLVRTTGERALTVDLDVAGDGVSLDESAPTRRGERVGQIQPPDRSDRGGKTSGNEGHLPGLVRRRGAEACRKDDGEDEEGAEGAHHRRGGGRRRHRRASTRAFFSLLSSVCSRPWASRKERLRLKEPPSLLCLCPGSGVREGEEEAGGRGFPI